MIGRKVIEKRDSTNGVRYAAPMARKPARKLGRPPASSSIDTRQRILDVARQTFADVGWEVTTNKVVAEKADVTSAAIYHYFDSKLEMYRAVHDDAEEQGQRGVRRGSRDERHVSSGSSRQSSSGRTR